MFSDKAINLGFLSIQYYALCIIIGAAIALYLSYRQWKFVGYKTSDLSDFFFNVLLVGIIGARLWYVIMKADYYLANPLSIFAVWEGGLAIQGGLIAGFIYGYYYYRRRGYNFLNVADIILPNVLIAQALGRWGNFFNQEAFGNTTTHEFLKGIFLPDFIVDKMFINGAYHHPTFLYESLYCILIFIIIKLIVRFVRLKAGQAGLLYFIFYSFGRIFIEHLRTDSLMFFDLKMAQILSIIIIIVATYFFFRFDKNKSINIIQEKRRENELKANS